MQHWLITYNWGKTNTSMEAWEGSIAEWVLMAIEQPEDWNLLNAASIDWGDYSMLKGAVS